MTSALLSQFVAELYLYGILIFELHRAHFSNNLFIGYFILDIMKIDLPHICLNRIKNLRASMWIYHGTSSGFKSSTQSPQNCFHPASKRYVLRVHLCLLMVLPHMCMSYTIYAVTSSHTISITSRLVPLSKTRFLRSTEVWFLLSTLLSIKFALLTASMRCLTTVPLCVTWCGLVLKKLTGGDYLLVEPVTMYLFGGGIVAMYSSTTKETICHGRSSKHVQQLSGDSLECSQLLLPMRECRSDSWTGRESGSIFPDIWRSSTGEEGCASNQESAAWLFLVVSS